jgi:geranylgeranyl transferase type-2 subunit alpha
VFVVHGWEYRRYVVANLEQKRGTSLSKSEFAYTTTKTNNISNFSAWHNRANLIPALLPPWTDSNFEQEKKTFLMKGMLSSRFGADE